MALLASGRAKRGSLEFVTGLIVLVGLVLALALALIGNGRRGEDGYRLSARFDHVDGLTVGSDVRLAGVTVGQVVDQSVDPKDYHANVVFTVRHDIVLPTDSSAIVTSDSLLGGKYLALQPGGAEKTLQPGGRVTLTQGSISLEQLLSKFIFSVTDSLSAKNKSPAGGAAPAPVGGSLEGPAGPGQGGASQGGSSQGGGL